MLSIRNLIMLIAAIYTILVGVMAVTAIILLQQEKLYKVLEADKYQAFRLASELKQSSDDLTRFARTYVVTGDERYQSFFRAIIAIRDGQQPRPAGYTRSYWDHVTVDDALLNQDGERYSIEKRMIDLGLTPQEIAKLTEAKRESDDLIYLEDTAMNAVKGLYRDDSGRFAVRAAADLEMAIKLLYGKKYHEAKSRIMKPIDDFFSLLEQRYANELESANKNKQYLLLLIIVLILVTIGFSVYAFVIFKARIITPLSTLGMDAKLIQEGNYSHHIAHAHNDEIGILVDSISSMANTLTETLRSREIILDNAVVAIAQLTENHFCWANQHMSHMFGYTLDEFKEQGLELLFANPDDYKRMNMESFPKLTQGKIFEGQYQFKHKNGTILWCFINGKSIESADATKGIIYIIVNITEQKMAEQAILKAAEVAESANQAKSHFLANVSHELRTPLNAVIGLSQLMLMSSLDENQRLYVNRTLEAANNLLEIISGILDISQIESGKIQLEKIDFPLREIITNAAKVIEEDAQKKKLQFTLDIANNVPEVINSDPKRLQRLLMILGNNAVKFTEPGGSVTVSVVLDGDTHRRSMLHFSVRDTGIGISPQQQSQLFTLFSQVDTSSTRQFGGLGLGLALARKIVELMRGEIWVESEYGKGSIFYFKIPLTRQ
ncbi:MAG: PAS domain S-box protein [Burkholderiales bacterium]|nr:PAS domain S-box protein [Burkholderiales bacterium]MDR4517614.1 ATP-binding protein [Nitrosomonas sp.]